MSMTYYAVTDDPNELVHWGVKGMKWGVRHDKPRHPGSSRPRSVAYKRAQSKLGKMMRNGIKKAEANWKAYNSPKAKEARFMKKAMQQARNGTLKYGKLTDAQVQRVTDRLALESRARQLGSTENPSYAKRIKIAVGEGIVRGIGQGTGAYIEERFRGRGRTTAEIKADKRKTKYENETALVNSMQRKPLQKSIIRLLMRKVILLVISQMPRGQNILLKLNAGTRNPIILQALRKSMMNRKPESEQTMMPVS